MFNKHVSHAHYVQSTLKVFAFFKSRNMYGCSKNNSKLEHNLRFLVEFKKAKLKGHDANMVLFLIWI